MPSYTVSIAAATALVGFDLASGARWKEQANDRVMVAIGLCGSAAEGDTEVDVFIDETRIATVFNTKLLFPDEDDMLETGVIVPANAEVSFVVQDAPTTNPLNLRVDFGA